MPLKVTDLKPGDRVLLNCPKSRVTAKREAVFEGIFASLSEAQERTGTVHIDLVDDTAFAFLSQERKAGHTPVRALRGAASGMEGRN